MPNSLNDNALTVGNGQITDIINRSGTVLTIGEDFDSGMWVDFTRALDDLNLPDINVGEYRVSICTSSSRYISFDLPSSGTYLVLGFAYPGRYLNVISAAGNTSILLYHGFITKIKRSECTEYAGGTRVSVTGNEVSGASNGTYAACIFYYRLS